MTFMRDFLVTAIRAQNDAQVTQLFRTSLTPEQVRSYRLFHLSDNIYAHKPLTTSLYINSLILRYVYGGQTFDAQGFLEPTQPVFQPQTSSDWEDYHDFLCHVMSDPYLYEHNQQLQIVNLNGLPSRAWAAVVTCPLEHETDLIRRLAFHPGMKLCPDLMFRISDYEQVSHLIFALSVSAAAGYSQTIWHRCQPVSLAGTYHPLLYRNMFKLRSFHSLDFLLQMGLTRTELVTSDLLAKSLRPKGYVTSKDFLEKFSLTRSQLEPDRFAQLLRDLGYFVPDLIKWWIRNDLEVGQAFDSITLDEWNVLERDPELMSLLKDKLMNDTSCCPANISLLLHMTYNVRSVVTQSVRAYSTQSTKVWDSTRLVLAIPPDYQTTIW